MSRERKTRISAEFKLLAERFRAERLIGRFGQAELANEIGVTRAAVSNIEYGLAKLSFSAGYAFCRRLDVNPRWLATGKEPKRPFVELSELGVDQASVDQCMRRGVDFLQGYGSVLEKPLAAWVKKTPQSAIIMRYLEAGPDGVARRLSNEELESKFVETVMALKSEREDMKIALLRNADAFLSELKNRYLTKKPHLRSLLKFN
ncbi:MAG: helix-turn-helix transcriptional regulator [Opitutaceae bacterium]|nr:helix-turn-helix transcriptional regulator [Opitutaceae bacterium]